MHPHPTMAISVPLSSLHLVYDSHEYCGICRCSASPTPWWPSRDPEAASAIHRKRSQLERKIIGSCCSLETSLKFLKDTFKGNQGHPRSQGPFLFLFIWRAEKKKTTLGFGGGGGKGGGGGGAALVFKGDWKISRISPKLDHQINVYLSLRGRESLECGGHVSRANL